MSKEGNNKKAVYHAVFVGKNSRLSSTDYSEEHSLKSFYDWVMKSKWKHEKDIHDSLIIESIKLIT